MSLKDLETVQNYYKIVQAHDAPALTCSICEALVLYYIDTDDRVYFKCLGCNRISYPGSPTFDSMSKAYDEWKH